MKMKKSELNTMIVEIVQEQLDLTTNNLDIQPIEELFNYIREKLYEKDFIMAKRFVDNLKEKVQEIELRSYGLETYKRETND